MSKFKEFLLDESKAIDSTIKNLTDSIKNMESVLKLSRGDKEQQNRVRRIINKQKELIKEIEANYE